MFVQVGQGVVHLKLYAETSYWSHIGKNVEYHAVLRNSEYRGVKCDGV